MKDPSLPEADLSTVKKVVVPPALMSVQFRVVPPGYPFANTISTGTCTISTAACDPNPI